MALFVPSPGSVQTFRATGTGNMGDVTDDDDRVKFWLDAPFVLVLCRFWVSGGTGTPVDINLKQQLTTDEEPSELFNQVVRIFSTFGTDGVRFHDFRVQADENAHWSWLGGTLLVPEWANPDPGNMTWKTEFRLAPIV